MSTVSPLPLLRNRVRVREAKKTARGSCRGNHGPPHQHTPPPRAPHPQEEGRESAEPLPLRAARLLEWLCPGDPGPSLGRDPAHAGMDPLEVLRVLRSALAETQRGYSGTPSPAFPQGIGAAPGLPGRRLFVLWLHGRRTHAGARPAVAHRLVRGCNSAGADVGPAVGAVGVDDGGQGGTVHYDS